MILIAIQLLPPSTKRVNSRGAKGRKSRGLRQPSSHTTLMTAAVTLGSSSVSISMSLIFGHAGRSVSGYASARRYSVTIVFFRTLGFEWVRRGMRSINNDSARDVVMMCGSVTSGREIVGMDGEVMSSDSSQPGLCICSQSYSPS